MYYIKKILSIFGINISIENTWQENRSNIWTQRLHAYDIGRVSFEFHKMTFVNSKLMQLRLYNSCIRSIQEATIKSA